MRSPVFGSSDGTVCAQFDEVNGRRVGQPHVDVLLAGGESVEPNGHGFARQELDGLRPRVDDDERPGARRVLRGKLPVHEDFEARGRSGFVSDLHEREVDVELQEVASVVISRRAPDGIVSSSESEMWDERCKWVRVVCSA